MRKLVWNIEIMVRLSILDFFFHFASLATMTESVEKNNLIKWFLEDKRGMYIG